MPGCRQIKSSSSQSQAKSDAKSEGKPKNSQANSQSGGSKSGKGTAQGGSKVVKRVSNTERSPWDNLRDRERGAEAFSAIKDKFPARYQKLVALFGSYLNNYYPHIF